MIHIWDSKDNQFFFTVVAGNGNTLATSETYTRKQNALKGAAVLVELLCKLDPTNIPIIDHTIK